MKRLPRKYKKKLKKQGLIVWLNAINKDSIKQMLEFRNRRMLFELLEKNGK